MQIKFKVSNKCKFIEMDGENMSYKDNHFDYAIEYGALHHVDLEKALKELSRVLKPDGKMLCIEALSITLLFMLIEKELLILEPSGK